MKTYPERLLEIGINLLEPYTHSKAHTKMQCVTCLYEWSATPLSKLQNFKKHGAGGCPECTRKRNYSDKQAANKASLPTFIEVVSEWNGSRNFQGAEAKVTFRNTNCGHEFESYPNYILAGKTECTVCGKEQRIAELVERSEATRMYDDPAAWKDYVSLVDKYTRRTYQKHKDVINPNNYPRKRTKDSDGYQLDHILPKAIGFQLGIPPEELSHLDNLQMLPRMENLLKKHHLRAIPLIFRRYFATIDVIETA